MHRLFTFPLDFFNVYPFTLLHMLSDLGLFVTDVGGQHTLRCQFCQLVCTAEQLPLWYIRGAGNVIKMVTNKHKNCKIDADNSENVPMGRNVGDVLNYKYEAHRLFSLLKKSDWQFVDPFGLAKSGFYYTQDEDNVRCVFCSLEVRGWEEGDTPDAEHRRWNPNCPFLLDEKRVLNFPIGSEQEAKLNTGCNPFAKPRALHEFGARIRLLIAKFYFPVTLHDLNVRDWSAPLRPELATLESRIDSFNAFWPKCMTQQPLAMAKAGFYYTGNADRVFCFLCNLGLKDWAPGDDPFVQHCKWNPACQYLQMCKGPRFVKKVLQRNKFEPIENVPAKRNACKEMSCVKCELINVSKVNLPCGHMTFCNLFKL